MKVSILIPTWKRDKLLKKALQSVSNQTLAPDEVIVSYRAEDLAAYKVIKEFQSTLPLISNLVEEPGVIYAENSALSIASGEIICFLDDDAEAPKNWIETIVSHFKSDLTLGAVGGPDFITGHYNPNYRKNVSKVGVLTNYGKLIGNHHHMTDTIYYVDVLKGVNMAFKKECIKLLDQKLQSLHHEGNGSHWELDLCLHVKAQNKRLLFDPKLDLLHHSNHDHFVFNKNHINNARNYTYVICKYFNGLQKLQFFFYIIFIGNTQIFGLLKFLTELLKGPRSAILTYIYSLRGFIKGLKAYYE